jgi:hypothetical protein
MVAAVGWTLLIYAPLPLPAFTVLAAVTSFACGAVVVAFAFAKESVPVRFLGTISGAVNVGNMLGPTLLQPAIGRVLDARWSGALAGGARVYSVDAYQAAFAMIVAWLALTCVLIALTKETACRPTA